jgi:hypothetical protein
LSLPSVLRTDDPALRRCEKIDKDDVCKRRRLRDADPFIAVGSRDDVQPLLAQPCRSGASSTESSSMTRTRPLHPIEELHATIDRSLVPLHLGKRASAVHG